MSEQPCAQSPAGPDSKVMLLVSRHQFRRQREKAAVELGLARIPFRGYM